MVHRAEECGDSSLVRGDAIEITRTARTHWVADLVANPSGIAGSRKSRCNAVHEYEDAPDDLRRREHAMDSDCRDVAWIDASCSGGTNRP